MMAEIKNHSDTKTIYRQLEETGRVSPEVVKEVLTTLKEDREAFLEAVDDDRTHDFWW